MKKVSAIVSLVTLFAVIYHMSPFIGVPDVAIFAMFIVSPFLIIYMVYVILRYGEASGNTFEERFYDDLDYKRNGIE